MHRFILAAALGLVAGSATAAGVPCDKPEYLQLKTADKAELQQEFCRTTRTYALNIKLQRDARDGISPTMSDEDAARRFADLDKYLDAALSCSRASAQFAGALERRFKTKPPADTVCNSPGGI